MKDNYYENKSFLEYYEKIGASIEAFEKSREIKAKKIIAVLNDYAVSRAVNLKNLTCLDIGCSTGLITGMLAEHFKHIAGIDIDRKALERARSYFNKDNLSFKEGSAMSLPFKNETFDVIICNHVYEHVPDCGKLFSEIYRVLKKKGFCYLAAGNKFNVIEPHYKLPFLSWLPKSLANLYLKIAGKGTIYVENHLSFWNIQKALKHFKIKDYTLEVTRFPEKYYLIDMIKPNSLIIKLPSRFLKLLEPVIPVFIFIIEKE